MNHAYYESPVAANEKAFEPAEFKDPAFNHWAHRTAKRLLSLPPGSAADCMQRVFFAEGTLSPEWASALLFMMKQVRSKQRADKKAGAA